MLDGVDENDELTLVCSKQAMSWRHWPTEVGDRLLIREQHRPKAMSRGITLDDEWPCEVRKSQDGCRGDHGFKGQESHGGLAVLGEAILLEQRRQWGCDGAEVVDKLAVVSRKA